jgi:hypothetical protein
MPNDIRRAQHIKTATNHTLEHSKIIHNTHKTLAQLNLNKTKQITGPDKSQEKSKLTKLGVGITLIPEPFFISEAVGIPIIVAGILKNRMNGNGRLTTGSMHAEMHRLIEEIKTLRKSSLH